VNRASIALVVVACGARTELDRPDAGPPFDASAADVVDARPNVDAPVIAATCSATTTTVLAKADAELDAVAVDDAYVYFHDGTRISRVPKGGGAVEMVASVPSLGWPYVGAFILRDDLAWLSIGSGGTSTSIVTGPKTGGASSVLLTESGTYYGVSAAPSGFFLFGGSVTNSKAFFVSSQGAATSIGTAPPIANAMTDSDGTCTRPARAASIASSSRASRSLRRARSAAAV
jgi:hypothetical protein